MKGLKACRITFFRSRGCLGGEQEPKKKQRLVFTPAVSRVALPAKRKTTPGARNEAGFSCLPPFRDTQPLFPRFMDGRLPAAAAAAVAGAAMVGCAAFAASPSMARFKAATRAVDEVRVVVCVLASRGGRASRRKSGRRPIKKRAPMRGCKAGRRERPAHDWTPSSPLPARAASPAPSPTSPTPRRHRHLPQ